MKTFTSVISLILPVFLFLSLTESDVHAARGAPWAQKSSTAAIRATNPVLGRNVGATLESNFYERQILTNIREQRKYELEYRRLLARRNIEVRRAEEKERKERIANEKRIARERERALQKEQRMRIKLAKQKGTVKPDEKEQVTEHKVRLASDSSETEQKPKSTVWTHFKRALWSHD